MLLDDATRHNLLGAADRELSRYKQLDKNIKHYKERIQLITLRMTAAKAYNYDSIRVQDTYIKADAQMVQYLDMKHDCTAKMERCVTQMSEIRERVARRITDDRARRVIERYYIDGQSIRVICEAENYSKRQVLRLKESGLIEYAKKMAPNGT